MTSTTQTPPDLTDTVRDMAARATVAVGLLGVGLIHVIDSVGKYTETRYLFWMYMGLILSSIAIAGALLFTRSRLAMPAAIGLVASALAGFILDRTTGLPNASGDIGNWTEPIGLANMFVEGAILFVAVPAQLMAARAVTHARALPGASRLSPAAA
ncbi:hypothetical protein NBH00_14220 [Paraconexibacter antarcticus]|uniref:Uncharacterized protein n=1 Tax=Paraconexibacter antarcticus TaxID=2949664 RepID=A0ABY5DMW2_9ACTN|nr:hypothetical protein [Paraconexibacter antarcticus]UTI62518.1 hypothetical protein NBH00_14220 [Paraconexibacter antarcticus]